MLVKNGHIKEDHQCGLEVTMVAEYIDGETRGVVKFVALNERGFEILTRVAASYPASLVYRRELALINKGLVIDATWTGPLPQEAFPPPSSWQAKKVREVRVIHKSRGNVIRPLNERMDVVDCVVARRAVAQEIVAVYKVRRRERKKRMKEAAKRS